MFSSLLFLRFRLWLEQILVVRAIPVASAPPVGNIPIGIIGFAVAIGILTSSAAVVSVRKLRSKRNLLCCFLSCKLKLLASLHSLLPRL
jgi:hypothetical protein